MEISSELSQHLEKLEAELLSNSTRKDSQRLSELLHDGFREFGASGRVYSKAEIVALLQNESPANLRFEAFTATPLAENVVLVTYTSLREQPGGAFVQALRSSTWVRRERTWQMIFHQGTRIP